MPVWSNTGSPAGPLNYKQIDDLIAFIRAEKTNTYRVLDPEPVRTGHRQGDEKEKTFQGWVDPAYKPAPGATPYPACWSSEFATPAPSASAGASGAPAPSVAPGAVVLQQTALNVTFGTPELSAPADAAFQIEFDNQDGGIQHNIEIKDPGGKTVFKGDLVTGPAKTTYNVPALAAGAYTFVCTVHPNMTGTLKVGG